MTILTSLALACIPAAVPAQSDPRAYGGDLHGDWETVLAESAADELIPISIVLRRQVERESLAALSGSRLARRELVRARLKEVAADSQGPLVATLRAHADAGRADRIRPLWIHNVIGARVTPDVALEIAAREDVDYVHHDPPPGESIFVSAPSIAGPATTCGLDRIRVPEVLTQYGIDGQGVVVGVIDSGICRTHPDIEEQIWTNPCEVADNGVDDDGNGFIDDTWGWDFQNNDNDPEDIIAHGSHVAGTVAGDGTLGTQAGVAPGVEVMSLKIVPTFSGEQSVWDCMQYGVDNGADILTASLGWPQSQLPDRATWRAVCDNTIAAGVVVIYAAGNESCSPGAEDIRTPADVPDVIAVGAVDCFDNIASFSSCGPVTWQDVPPYLDNPFPPGLTKPDVTAPGVNVVSHSVCSDYVTFSGTSMAAPHVAGVAAMLLQADPTLDHFGVRSLLESTSVDLGASGKDNSFGSGRIDAFAAVTAALASGNYCAPKQNSCGTTPIVRASGRPSATEASGFTVTASNLLGNSVALLVYSDQGPANTPLFGGALCVTGARRSIPVPSVGTTGLCDGVASIDMNAFRSGSLGGNPLGFLSIPGTTITCQFWSRDVANTFGAVLSGGLSYTICP
ncbi:MAG: S8 family serine peptidase [Planctomycetota bacterium]